MVNGEKQKNRSIFPIVRVFSSIRE